MGEYCALGGAWFWLRVPFLNGKLWSRQSEKHNMILQLISKLIKCKNIKLNICVGKRFRYVIDNEQDWVHIWLSQLDLFQPPFLQYLRHMFWWWGKPEYQDKTLAGTGWVCKLQKIHTSLSALTTHDLFVSSGVYKCEALFKASDI